MDIQADVEQLGTPTQIQGVGAVPTTTKRQAGAKVAVNDGQTVILGGFISADRSKSNSGIPWLKDIPLLGPLFRSSTTENDRTELIILLRPTVLNTPDAASRVASIEQRKMAAVRQAELEIREDEDRRNRNAAIQMHDAEKRRLEQQKKELKKHPWMTNSVPTQQLDKEF